MFVRNFICLSLLIATLSLESCRTIPTSHSQRDASSEDEKDFGMLVDEITLTSHPHGLLLDFSEELRSSFDYFLIRTCFEDRCHDTEELNAFHLLRASREGEYTVRVFGCATECQDLGSTRHLATREDPELANIDKEILVLEEKIQGYEIDSTDNLQKLKQLFIKTKRKALAESIDNILKLRPSQRIDVLADFVGVATPRSDVTLRANTSKEASELDYEDKDLDVYELPSFSKRDSEERVNRLLGVGLLIGGAFAGVSATSYLAMRMKLEELKRKHNLIDQQIEEVETSINKDPRRRDLRQLANKADDIKGKKDTLNRYAMHSKDHNKYMENIDMEDYISGVHQEKKDNNVILVAAQSVKGVAENQETVNENVIEGLKGYVMEGTENKLPIFAVPYSINNGHFETIIIKLNFDKESKTVTIIPEHWNFYNGPTSLKSAFTKVIYEIAKTAIMAAKKSFLEGGFLSNPEAIAKISQERREYFKEHLFNKDIKVTEQAMGFSLNLV